MAQALVPSTARVKLFYNFLEQLCLSIFHVEETAPAGWPTASLNSLNTTVSNWWNANVKALQSDQCSLLRVTAQDIGTANGEQRELTVGTPGTVSASDPLPSNVASCVSWRTALTGRSFHGRTYHMGMVESQVVGNSLTSGFQTALQTAYGALITAITTAAPTQALVVVSYVTNGAPRPSPNTANITAARVDSRPDSMNTRKARLLS